MAALIKMHGFAIIQPEPRPEPFLIPFDDIQRSCKLKSYFHTCLVELLGTDRAAAVLSNYHVGLSNSKWPGATVFFSVDINGQPRRGKVMVFDPNTSKRVKDSGGKALISSIHAILGKRNEKPDACFFGEHLLKKYPDKPVAVVESEKTAVIASAYLPEFIWLSCDGSGGISRPKFDVLKDRRVILFPDMGCADKWQQKADVLGMPNVTVSRYLEDNNAPDGSDIADFLTTQPLLEDYPASWDQLPEHTEEYLKFRFINWAESFEHYHAIGKIDKCQSILDEIAAAGFDAIPDEIMIKHAPITFKNIQE
ncbi:MAG: hypothetical protein J7539_13295 [Niabella sp.]|nr:hypothetical protein [Niabella sp.]